MRSIFRRGMQWVVMVALFFAFISGGMVHASTISVLTDVMTREKISQAAQHRIQFVSPNSISSSSNTIILRFDAGFDLSSIVLADIALSQGSTTGFETPLTLGDTPGSGIWNVSIAGQFMVFTPPSDVSIMPGTKLGIIIGRTVGGHLITNPSIAGAYHLSIYGGFGGSGEATIDIRSEDTQVVTATMPTITSGGGVPTPPPSGDGGGTSGGAPPSRDIIDGAPPVLSGISAIRVTTSTVDIVWSTDEPATSRVEYGPTSSLGSNVANGALTTSHTVHLSGLVPGTDYFFRVTSSDAVGNTAVDPSIHSFTTAALPRAPVISALTLNLLTDRSVMVTWTTDIETTGSLEYGRTTDYGSSLSTGSAVSRSHVISLDGLSAETIYHVRVHATSAEGLSSVSSDLSFTTAGDRTPPANPFNFRAAGGDRRVTVSWDNPTDVDFAYVMVRGRTDRYPTSPEDGRLVYQGSGNTAADTSLTPSTRYFYTIFAFDRSRNASSGASADATTFAIAPPVTPPVVPPTTPPVTPPVTPPPIVPPTTPPTTPTRPGDPTSPSIPTTPPPTTPSGDGHSGTTTSTPAIPSVTSSTTPTPPAEGSVSSSLPVPPIIDATGGVAPSSTTTGGETGPGVSATLESEQVNFHIYGGNGTVELIPDAQGNVAALSGQSLIVRIPLIDLSAAPQSGVLTVGSDHYLLKQNAAGSDLETSFTPSMTPGNVRLDITLDLVGGRHKTGSRVVHVLPLAWIYEQTLLARNQTSIDGASVQIYHQANGAWSLLDASQMGQSNPMITGQKGAYGFIVPNGRYQVRVSKDGYRAEQREATVTNNVLNISIGLTKELKSLSALIDPKAPLSKNLQAVGEQAAVITEDVRQVVQDPKVQQATQNVVAPAVVVASVATTATAVSTFNLLNYLRFLLTQPLLLIGRRKRKKWGVVYNALNKQPIELAIVRLLQAKTKLVVQTRITDAQGRFSFMVPPGEYIMQIIKPGFGFPTTFLGGQREDGDFLDLYHGEPLVVKEATTITPNVPLDPAAKEETPKQVLRKAMWRKLQTGLSFSGVVASFAALLIKPSLLMGGFIVFQIGSYFLFKRLAVPPKPKEWGVAYNAENKKPLEKTVVRIFDKKFNKLLETQVTDKEGKYGFFAGKSLYYVTAEKAGYEKVVTSDLDFTNKQDAFVDQRLALKPLK